ncbi:hypothetical protein [Actinomadura decatromicini]|uniref:GH26 domain-containing protein n=1 Tax=Actinomadura decatromicini TaxID=2604572 RepID=A0A5D3F966_9ACTN|nr:hypothetical protein [Actinomadura decatromicini]TYK44376.1 hypothetical protein FXF68_33390 [Actinomadura decatromicini]
MTHARPDQRNTGRNAILWGAAGDRLSGSDFPGMDDEFGPLTIRRSYQPAAVGMPEGWAESNAGVDVGARASCWSGKPSITAMARGALDQETLAFLRSIPEDHLAFVSIWHEADGKIRSGSFGLTVYRAAFRRFCRLVQRVKAEGRPLLHTIQILTTWSGTSPRAGSTYADLWPGDDLVDCFGVDGYSHVGSGDSLWGPAVEFADSKGVPWAVPEIGYGRTGTRDVGWLNDQVEYLTSTAAGGRHTRCAFACWFNTAGPISVRTPGGNPAWVAAARSASRRYHCPPADFTL